MRRVSLEVLRSQTLLSHAQDETVKLTREKAMPDLLRVAVVGCGYFAANHLTAWKRLDGVEVAGVCDLNAEKARGAADRFGVARWFTDAAIMLHDLGPNFVDIATTMASHRNLVELCAAKGVPVIVQKPFGPTYADCTAMVEACRKASVPLMVHENFRFQPPLRRVRRILDSGAIGELLWGRISFRTGEDVKAPQPYLYHEERFIILDLGPHLIDIARFYFGEVDKVFARHRRVDPRIRGEDMATIMLGHTKGATSILDLTYESRKLPDLASQTLVSIEGTAGAVELAAGFQLGITANGNLTIEDAPAPLRIWATKQPHPALDSVYLTQAHWIDCLRQGREPETSGRDSLKTYAIIEAAYESAATGQAVTPIAA
jgi:predicted dehydrogenase